MVTNEHGEFALKVADREAYRLLAVARGVPLWSWAQKRFIPSEKGNTVRLHLGPMAFSKSDPEPDPNVSWDCTRLMPFRVFGTWVSQWECTDSCGEESLHFSFFTEWED
ncbi:hypothetical protein LZ198_21685 [Myxococcus sp. K15C18031901]|uniref:hypothetical protein n=1 Tax=Myxococcus dinghuensis TaxID=2906761 RepID=UPI0020A7853E|nr:hypothetical protein [Myxococcus dinghuensis]MCP3101491.1 hypothetical protein [Myxococcus dinghuensis]